MIKKSAEFNTTIYAHDLQFWKNILAIKFTRTI